MNLIGISSNLTASAHPSTTRAYAKWLLVASCVSTVAGLALIALSFMQIFDPIGSMGFIASLTIGSSLTSAGIVGMIWTIVLNCKEPIHPKPHPRTEYVDPLYALPKPWTHPKKQYEELRSNFIKAAQQRLNDQTESTFVMPPCPRALDQKAFVDGGDYLYLALKSLPGVVFKKPHVENSMSDYVQRAEHARQVCKDHNLYLLYAPQCQLVNFDPSIVMEEKLDLPAIDWTSQAACYQWAIEDPKLQPYIKEVFRQLTIFICLTKFSEVRYDTIPIMLDGRVALIKRDTSDALKGLTMGCAPGRNGLFNMIPSVWYKEMIPLAGRYLEPQDFERLQSRLPLLERNTVFQQREISIQHEFYLKQKITLPTQKLHFDRKLFSAYQPIIGIFADAAIKIINEQLVNLTYLSLSSGREVILPIGIDDPICQEMHLSKKDFRLVVQQGLRAMRDQGYFFAYEIKWGHYHVRIIC